jgi:hypothetical protein
MRTSRVALACWLLSAVPAAAQYGVPSRLALDTSAAIDVGISETGDAATGIVVDSVATVSLGRGFEAIVRPWAQKLGNSSEWNRQIWIATLRYERTGPVGLRIDGGLIGSPVGLGNMMLRPAFNPTITMPSSLFVPLPAPAPNSPRATLLGVLYPYGVSATASTRWWDARAAIIDSSPLRMRRVFAQQNPPRFANVVVGGGITPIVGLRVGASVTHGGWQQAGESPGVTADLDATVFTIESEFSYRYTTMAAEWVHDRIQTAGGQSTPSGWFVQGQHTLSPRWFAAARVERMTASGFDPLVAALEERHFTGVESAAGYRLTPEITIRGGHRARQLFGRQDVDHAAAMSVVWWRRWK